MRLRWTMDGGTKDGRTGQQNGMKGREVDAAQSRASVYVGGSPSAMLGCD